MTRTFLLLLFTAMATMSTAATGTWKSSTTGTSLKFTSSKAIGTAAKDAGGKPMTIVYLEHLNMPKYGQNNCTDDVTWLRQEGYQVIELDYDFHEKAVSPLLNIDIMAINRNLQNGAFCNMECSPSRSYILMEGFRIQRDIPYYQDDPTIYNYPDNYKATDGDWLYMDLVYPANPSANVPVLVTFSYSNSSHGKAHQRMYLPYFWGQFNDSFVEGASALGFAWAVCDHPKYCEWGQGKYTGGANKSLGAIEVNPDAVRKVKSAIRTVRGIAKELGLNSNVAVTGFSRGSTAAALAVGDGVISDYEDATRGRFPEESSQVQCALLGPGMFDYEHALSSSNEYLHMKSFVTAHPAYPWAMQSALATIETSASAPTLFFHNTDDYYKDDNKNAAGLYATQAKLMKARLDEVGVVTETLTDYSTGHAVPQTATHLQIMYDFLLTHINVPTPAGIDSHFASTQTPSGNTCYNLLGNKVRSSYKGLMICSGKLYIKR